MSQQEVLKRCNHVINQSTYSTFEKGRYRTQENNLNMIAEALNINPDFLKDSNQNLFRSDHLIKLHITFSTIKGKPIEPFASLILNSGELEFISLITDMNIFTRIKNLSLSERPIYAVAVKDSDNNYFIIRRKSSNRAVLVDTKLEQALNLFVQHEAITHKKIFAFSEQTISSELYEKIRNWTVCKADIEPLFKHSDHAFFPYLKPTTDEMWHLSKLRDCGFIPNEDELKLIKAIRNKGITPQSINDLLNHKS